MKMLLAVLATAFVTFWVTNIWARDDTRERFAQLLWAKCPQLIFKPHDPETAWVEFLDGSYVPIRPRRGPAGTQSK